MTRRGVTGFLLVYFGVLWLGVAFRVDRFPLTWAPMYASVSPQRATFSRRIVDKEEMGEGLVVTHRDGTESRVNQHDLNIPKWNFYRVYYQRAFGGSPPKYNQLYGNISPLNLWVRGLDAVPPEADWGRRLFYTVNRTLGHTPEDPRFIVRIQAWEDRAHFQREPLGFVERTRRHADLRWDEAWREDFDAGPP